MKNFDQLLDGRFKGSVNLMVCLAVATAALGGCAKKSSLSVNSPVYTPATTVVASKVVPLTNGGSSALLISPVSPIIYSDQTLVLSAAGGTAPYSYSIVSGSGSISGGVYTPVSSATSAMSALIEVTDSLGDTDETSVTVNPVAMLQVTPSAPMVAINASVNLNVTGGIAPYAYAVISGNGSFSGNSFEAPGSAETDQVQITDSSGQTLNVNVSVRADTSLQVSPQNPSVLTGAAVTFAVTGGTGPYSFRLVSGNGALSGNVFTAPAAAETDQIAISDSLHESVLVSVNVIQDPAMVITPANPSIIFNAQVALSVTGGTAPFRYALVSGNGSLSGNVFTAPAVTETDYVTITDSYGQVVTLPITVQAPAETPIYVFVNNKTHDQMLSLQSVKTDVAQLGYVGQGFFRNLFANASVRGVVPVYRCYSAVYNDHSASASAGCQGGVAEEILGYASPTQLVGTVPLYRTWNSGMHLSFVTTDANEAASVGFYVQEIVGYIPNY